MKILVSEEFNQVVPAMVGGAVEATVRNSEPDARLWAEIDALCADYRARLTTESLKLMPAIEATRRVYRLCGKDPSRYRPSAEALIRRTLQGKPLYRIDTLVDLINLASMKSGYSIGGFDASKFVGDTLTLGIGRDDEPYEGIGRGSINIGGLPVYRDAIGGVGTPTSDHERTKMDLATTRVLILVNGYDGDTAAVRRCADHLTALLRCYADGRDVTVSRFSWADN